MPRFKRLSDLSLAGKTALVRSDLNVPMSAGKITDETRITRSVETWKALVDAGAKVVILTHFGRPKGKIVPEMSVEPLAAAISNAMGGSPVTFCPKLDNAKETIAGLPAGSVALLENLRFHPGEEANDNAFAQSLADLGDVYIGDAFSCAHRAHASVEAITRLMPSAAGLLMEAELENLAKALETPERPVMAVVGGAKVSTKLDLLGNLVSKVDYLVIGGGMANTFLLAQGHEVGKSLCEKDLVGTATEIMAKAKTEGCDIILPVDGVVAGEFAAHAAHETVSVTAVPADKMILDVGPDSVSRIEEILKSIKTIVWNGPLGAFEIPPFDTATVALAKAAASATRDGTMITVAGGGDTVAALAHAGVEQDFSYISTAGGAFLEWIEGKTLPGVAALVV